MGYGPTFSSISVSGSVDEADFLRSAPSARQLPSQKGSCLM